MLRLVVSRLRNQLQDFSQGRINKYGCCEMRVAVSSPAIKLYGIAFILVTVIRLQVSIKGRPILIIELIFIQSQEIGKPSWDSPNDFVGSLENCG